LVRKQKFVEKRSRNLPGGAENPMMSAEKRLQSSAVPANTTKVVAQLFSCRTVTLASGVFGTAGLTTGCSRRPAKADLGRNSSSDKDSGRRVCEIYIERSGRLDRSSLRTYPSLVFERLREECSPFVFGSTSYGLEPRQMGPFANKLNVLLGIAIVLGASEQRIC
jgi:hypothetical protein